jgi:hypothetical protein
MSNTYAAPTLFSPVCPESETGVNLTMIRKTLIFFAPLIKLANTAAVKKEWLAPETEARGGQRQRYELP